MNDSTRPQSGLPVRLDHSRILRYSGTPAAMANPSEHIALYRGGILIIAGLAAETIAVRGRVQGDGAAVDSDPVQVQQTDGTIIPAAALGNGTYYFDVLFERLLIQKSGGADNASVTVYLRT